MHTTSSDHIGADSDYITSGALHIDCSLSHLHWLPWQKKTIESQTWYFETVSLRSKSCPRLWHRCIKLSLISFCWFHCDSGGCDGLIPSMRLPRYYALYNRYQELNMRLLLCIIQLIPRTKYALAIMHYTADTQKSAWCHALCFASWHRCLAYFTLYIALRSFELDYIDCHSIFVGNRYCGKCLPLFVVQKKETMKENLAW